MDISIAPQDRAFQLTLDILRKQRDTQADLVVQLSVQVAMLTEHNTEQQKAIIALEKENAALRENYKETTEEQDRLRNQLQNATEQQ